MFFNPIVLFVRACRRFGFLRTVVFFVIGLVFLSLAVQAFAAPLSSGGAITPPIPSASASISDQSAFQGEEGSICRPDHSACPVGMTLRARLTNQRSSRSVPLGVQLLLTVHAYGCTEITCGGTVADGPQYRPVWVFVDGRRLSAGPLAWLFLSGYSSRVNGTALEAEQVFASQRFQLGLFGYCGWHVLGFGIKGDPLNAIQSTDGFGAPVTYPAKPAQWAFAPKTPFYAGDCSAASRHR